MALTAEEQAELDSLLAKPPAQTGLSQAEQVELDSLLAKPAAEGVEGTELSSEEGTELTSERGEIQGSAELEDLELFESARTLLSEDKLFTPLTSRGIDTTTLMEVVNQARVLRDQKKRSIASNELKRRGIPDEFVKMFTEIDDAKGFAAGLIGETPEMIGGFVGAGVGALAGRGDPKAVRRGAIIGGGIGEGAVELGREIFERKFRPERRRSALDLTKDTAFTAFTAALGEAGGRFILDPLLSPLNKPFAKAVIPDAPRISKELGQAGRQVAREGGASPLLGKELPIQRGLSRITGQIGLSRKVSAELTPDQQVASRALSRLTGLVEDAFFGGGQLNRTKDIAQKAALPRFIKNKVDDITAGLDILSLDEVGAIAQDAIHGSRIPGQETRGASGVFRAMQRVAYKDLPELIPEPIDISSVQKMAQSILKEAAPGGRRLKLPEKTEALLKNIVATGKDKSIDDLIFARSDIGELSRAARLAGEPKVEQVVNPMLDEMTSLMKKAAANSGEDAVRSLNGALELTAKGKKKFGANIIRRLVAEKTPSEKVVRTIFGAPGDETLSPLTAVRNIKDVLIDTAGKTEKEIVNDKYAWDQIRYSWLTSKIKTATKRSQSGVRTFKGDIFEEALVNLGDDALKEMFTVAEMKGIKDIALAGKLVGKKAESFGGFIVKGAQLGGVGAGAATGKKSIAALALGGPAVFGEFLTSAAGRKLFTTGFDAAGAEGQLIAGLLRTKKAMDRKQKRLEKFQEELRRSSRIRNAAPTTPSLQQQRGFGGRGL